MKNKKRFWWEVGVDTKDGTQTIACSYSKRKAENLGRAYLKQDAYKDCGIFIDEWTNVYDYPQPTGHHKVLRKFIR